jgi:trehalose 6-phosphate phosphatase
MESTMPHAAAIGTRLDGSPLVVLLDIDGTLAPIAPRPDEARIPDTTRDVLRRVIGLPGTVVALVTGRSADDASRMAIDGAWIIGNHGLELRSPRGDTTPDLGAARYADAVAAAARALAPLSNEWPGVILENKGLGLGIHYRLASPDAPPRIRERMTELARSTGLRLTEGKKIFELRPPVRVDKGTATLAFLDRVGALTTEASVLFAGDDRTDEDAFRVLRARSSRAVTIRVIADEDDRPATEAELVLASPDEVREQLDWLARRRAGLTS